MTTTLYVVDAFTNQPFAGNPAAVCYLDNPADEQWMKNVAREMNLAETAFVWPLDHGYSLRWLTPTTEVDLCGHATLASAKILWHTGRIAHDQVACFHTRSGRLTCCNHRDGIEMDFPALVPKPCDIPVGLGRAIGFEPQSLFHTSMDYLVEVPDELTLRSLDVNMNELAKFAVRGVIVTSKSSASAYDFVSRFFAPAAGVNEDPVTGSAHCALGPYWQTKLNKNDFVAFQASQRGGEVRISVKEDRVLLRGDCVVMSKIELAF